MSRIHRKTSNNKKINKIFYIFTEGRKTEFIYLNDLKRDLRLKKTTIDVQGKGKFGSDLVEYAIRNKEKEYDKDDIDREWCIVLDVDDNKDFNKIVQQAESRGIKVFYSNECFEMWILLHFEFMSAEIDRKNYASRLTGHLGFKYEKANENIYGKIKDKEHVAVLNAKKLEKMHDNDDTSSLFKRNPSSTVYKLVEVLRELKNNE